MLNELCILDFDTVVNKQVNLQLMYSCVNC